MQDQNTTPVDSMQQNIPPVNNPQSTTQESTTQVRQSGNNIALIIIIAMLVLVMVAGGAYWLGTNQNTNDDRKVVAEIPLEDDEDDNPVARNFADARNTQRASDVREILSAITQYIGEGEGTIDSLELPSCTDGAKRIGTGYGYVDLDILTPDYIILIPEDPKSDSSRDSGYEICYTGTRIYVSAPLAENGVKILVRR